MQTQYTDPAGTPIAMTDASGSVVWKADYKPFGEEWSITSNIENNKRFVGKEKDTETGLNYFGARYMLSSIGRFISTDPVGPVDPMTGEINQIIIHDPQRLNLYSYGLDNPYRYVDANGRNAVVARLIPYIDQSIAFLGGIIGALLTKKAIEDIKKSSENSDNKETGKGQSGTETSEDTGTKANTAPGQTASGQATDEHGNKLGPSGKPQIDKAKHSTKKGAKDAARNEGKTSPVKHTSPEKGNPHFHPTDSKGEKIPNSTHHEY